MAYVNMSSHILYFFPNFQCTLFSNTYLDFIVWDKMFLSNIFWKLNSYSVNHVYQEMNFCVEKIIGSDFHLIWRHKASCTCKGNVVVVLVLFCSGPSPAQKNISWYQCTTVVELIFPTTATTTAHCNSLTLQIVKNQFLLHM